MIANSLIKLIFVTLTVKYKLSVNGSSLCNDGIWLITDLMRVCSKSFLLSTAGFTCVAFVAGALALWAPLFMEYAIVYQGNASSIEDLESR